MKVLLIDIDSRRIPNLALKKIEKYHIDIGGEIMEEYFNFQPKPISDEYIASAFITIGCMVGCGLLILLAIMVR